MTKTEADKTAKTTKKSGTGTKAGTKKAGTKKASAKTSAKAEKGKKAKSSTKKADSKKGSKTKATKAKTEAKTEAEPVESTETETKTDDVASPVVPDSEFEAKADALLETLKGCISQFREMVKEVRTLKKVHATQAKKLEKMEKKSRSRNNNNSGIVKPTGLSPELCKFLGLEEGTQMARTAVISMMNKYFNENGLKKENDGRVIEVSKDAGLHKLLGCDKKTKEISFFGDLQTCLKPHFIKIEAPSTSA